jgi:hypothetical protein
MNHVQVAGYFLQLQLGCSQRDIIGKIDSFIDLDGHGWAMTYMDPSAFQK